MAIAFSDKSNLTESGGAVGIRTIPKPPALADGDFVIIITHNNFNGSVPADTTPSGFTNQRHIVDTSVLMTDVWIKTVTSVASEPTWQIGYGSTNSVKLNIDVVAYSGCDPTTPLLVDSIASEGTTATTTHVTPTINVTADGCWVVSAAADRAGTSATWTTSSGTDTERWDTFNGGASNQIAACMYDTNGNTVAQGNVSRTLTSTFSSAIANMWIGAIQPAASGGGTPVSYGYEINIG